MRNKLHNLILLTVFIVSILFSHSSAFAEGAYDLNGDWDATIVKTGISSGAIVANEKDIINFSQKGDEFIGVRVNGGKFVGKNEEMIKGKLNHKLVDEIFLRYVSDPITFDLSWIEGRSVITENGLVMEIHAVVTSTNYFETITMKRK